MHKPIRPTAVIGVLHGSQNHTKVLRTYWPGQVVCELSLFSRRLCPQPEMALMLKRYQPAPTLRTVITCPHSTAPKNPKGSSIFFYQLKRISDISAL